ncbi:hypothetical protein SKAU_G00028440 [Synaphobranchus kaupii]|uniref:Uncharacterized protein n=1 Tax=Synaphobranchus kaupii TaxID=118154 RepID=A0A9Q1GD58_SYNKA|nr:hypothetical protein SKAU_G00028440 [Synaphobranchus kaupii]
MADAAGRRDWARSPFAFTFARRRNEKTTKKFPPAPARLRRWSEKPDPSRCRAMTMLHRSRPPGPLAGGAAAVSGAVLVSRGRRTALPASSASDDEGRRWERVAGARRASAGCQGMDLGPGARRWQGRRRVGPAGRCRCAEPAANAKRRAGAGAGFRSHPGEESGRTVKDGQAAMTDLLSADQRASATCPPVCPSDAVVCSGAWHVEGVGRTGEGEGEGEGGAFSLSLHISIHPAAPSLPCASWGRGQICQGRCQSLRINQHFICVLRS